MTGGVVHLVGAGPGDPGLITVTGLALLRRAEVVIHDRLIPRELLSEVRSRATIIDAGKSPGAATLTQEEINDLLVGHARVGRRVVRLKGGDPFVFGRGWEELEACRAAGVACHVVPGVTSAVAAPAAIGVPVTARRIARSFAVVTAHVDPEYPGPPLDYAALAGLDTIIVLMGRAALSDFAASMIAAGRPADTPVACVQQATTNHQRHVIASLADIADRVDAAALAAPMVTIVGEVARLASAGADAAPGEGRPLAGRRVLLTRPRSVGESTRDALLALGARVIHCPLLRAVYGADTVHGAIDEFSRYDWLVLTSMHGVRAFGRALRARDRDARALTRVRIACVGPATARAAARLGLRPDLVPARHCADSLAAALAPHVRGARVLYPRSARAAPTLTAALQSAGATVDDVVAYTMTPVDPPPAARSLLREGVDAIVLFSPSAAQRVAALDLPRGRGIIVCIGPTTAAAAREAGLCPDVVADRHNEAGVIEALCSALSPGDAVSGSKP